MCITFALENHDQKNHFLAHFSEITSFLNRNNDCVSPGTFPTLNPTETKYRDPIPKLLKCSNQHYLWEVSTVKWGVKRDCATIESGRCNSSESLSFDPLVSPWRCLTDRRRFDCQVDILSRASSDNCITRRKVVLPIVKEYTAGRSAVKLIESSKDLFT